MGSDRYMNRSLTKTRELNGFSIFLNLHLEFSDIVFLFLVKNLLFLISSCVFILSRMELIEMLNMLLLKKMSVHAIKLIC